MPHPLRFPAALAILVIAMAALLSSDRPCGGSTPADPRPYYGLPLPMRTKAPAAANAANWIWAGTTKTTRPSTSAALHLGRRFRQGDAVRHRRRFLHALCQRQASRPLRAGPKDNNVWQHVHRVDIAPYPDAGPERPGRACDQCRRRGGHSSPAGEGRAKRLWRRMPSWKVLDSDAPPGRLDAAGF